MASSRNRLLLALFLVGVLAFDEIHRSLADDHDHDASDDVTSHVNFVVVGATGSLAQKYLWQGMYDLQETIGHHRRSSSSNSRRSGPDLVVYGGARADPLKGTKALEEILDRRVSYENAKAKQDFGASVQFVQLKTCEHYESLCKDVFNVPSTDADGRRRQHCHADGNCDDDDTPRIFADIKSTESGRIFYLAVPPYSYAEVAKCIHRVCRPSNPNAFLRLVLEKPFGTNVDTVNSLVTSLREDFVDDEIYLVDHYLGKPAVQQILQFRHLNRIWLEPLLNGHHVEKVEIAIKEKEDCEGRLNYFDTYGVFLDVLQNHAVEMFCLTAMNLPGQSVDDTEAIRREKLRFLRSVLPIHPSHVVAGQYSDYVAHGKLEFGNNDFDSRTPTFGAAVLQMPNSRWRGVPFFLVSGKALDAKTSLVRITFKNTTFPITDDRTAIASTKGEIVIYASSPENAKPWMTVSSTLSGDHPVLTTWSKMADESNRHAFQFEGRDRAYSTVVADVFFGRRENFVGMEQLTASWAIWDHYLKASKDLRPKLYRKGSPEDLEVTWSASGLRFATSAQDSSSQPSADKPDDESVSPPSAIHLCKAESAFIAVKPISKLVKDIVRDLMEIAEADDDDEFHIAIPGGNTPSPIFHELLSSSLTFPWHKTHVWFTDERCVPMSHPLSNLWNAEELLLKHLQMSHFNVHPMPVELKSGLCSSDDGGPTLYAEQLRRHLGENRSLDVVILGVGSDGHVASLFPHAHNSKSKTLEDECVEDGEDDKWVTLTTAGSDRVVDRQRMSLTFKTISKAKTVFVVITGKGKHGVVQHLTHESKVDRIASSRFPVKNVAAADSLRVYIDHDAYYG